MKRAIITTLIAALTLCSCGSGKQLDIKEDYKEYLDYAFDGDYSISDGVDRENDGINERVWTIAYTDAQGDEQTEEIVVNCFDSGDEELLKSECDWAVLNCVAYIRNRAVHAELADKLLSQHFEISEYEGIMRADGDGFYMYTELINCALYDPSDEDTAKELDPQSGMKYAGISLKDWAQDKTNALRISIVLEDAGRVEEFSEKLAEFGGDFVELTADPQNYCFELHAPDSSGQTQLVAAGCRVMGEETNADLFDINYIREKLHGGAQPSAETGAEGGLI